MQIPFRVFRGFSWFCFVVFRRFAFFCRKVYSSVPQVLGTSKQLGMRRACIKHCTAPLLRVSLARASPAAPKTLGDSPEAVPVS